MKTRSVYSEIMLSLSPSTNISESFKKLGIKDTSQDILLVALHSNEADAKASDLLGMIEGDLTPLQGIHSCNNTQSIIKEYNIPSEELIIIMLTSELCSY
ncbi:EKC/KEOPS complex subunit TPRKB-like [Halichondria panicea]|uniref:EKC/KEOPS complex subunit TPRKB-like n=1 Tax=Halichondria panicea TaxID=6063 RepID=UPI00312B4354